MNVRIYDYAHKGTWPVLRGTADLAEAIPDPDERARAEKYLKLVGKYWLGGGAAPLVLICTE
jgi:hypothetical protein